MGAGNAGIILLAGFDGNIPPQSYALPASGSPLDSDTITTPLSVSVNAANRVVLTLAMTFVSVTQWVVSAYLKNNGRFQTPSGGSALPATNNTGTANLNTNLNKNIPVLSVAQNDNQAGFQSIAHTYVGPVTADFIYLVGNLVGTLVVRVVPTYTVANQDLITIGVNLY